MTTLNVVIDDLEDYVLLKLDGAKPSLFDYLKKGYYLHGQPFGANHGIYQAVVKIKDNNS